MGYFYASIPCKRIQSIQLTFFVELCDLYCSTISPPDRCLVRPFRWQQVSYQISCHWRRPSAHLEKPPKSISDRSAQGAWSLVDGLIIFLSEGWYPIISPKIWWQDVLVFYIHPHTHTQTRENRHSLQICAFLWMVNWIHPGRKQTGTKKKCWWYWTSVSTTWNQRKSGLPFFCCAWCSLHR